MRRVLLLAALAGAFLGAGAVFLIWLATGGAESATVSRGPSEAAAGSAPAAPGETVAAVAVGTILPPGPGSSVPETVGPSSRASAAARSAVAPRGRAERRLLHARQVQQKVAARRAEGPGPGAGAERAGARGLPPEERAAMEAAGLDWRKLERMLEGAPPEEEGR